MESTEMLKKYSPSGRWNKKRTILSAIFGLLGVVVLAFLYQFLLWIPLIAVSVCVVLVFGGMVGGLASMVIYRGHVRNKMIAYVVGFGFGIFGVCSKFYWQYQYERWALFSSGEVAVRIDDGLGNQRIINADSWTFSDHLLSRYDQQMFLSYQGKDSKPLQKEVVLLLRGLEFLVVSLCSAGVAWFTFRVPFCEASQKWAEQEECVGCIPVESSFSVQRFRKVKTYQELLTVPEPSESPWRTFLVYSVLQVAGEESDCVFLKLDIRSKSEAGVPENGIEVLVDRVEISSVQLKELRERLAIDLFYKIGN